MTRSLVLAAAQLGPIQKAEGRDVAVGPHGPADGEGAPQRRARWWSSPNSR